MRASIVRTATTTLCLLALAGAAAAQETPDTPRRPTVHLLPSVTTMDGSLLGWRDNDFENGAWIRKTLTYGLAAEVRTPLRFLDVRAGVQLSRPVFNASSPLPPGPWETTRATVTSLSAEAVVRGPRVLEVQPYLLAGGGLRHYAFPEEQGQDISGAPRVKDQTVPLVHLGAGLAWNVGRYDLFVEAAQYHAYLEDRPGFRGTSQGDHTVTFGLRIPVR